MTELFDKLKQGLSDFFEKISKTELKSKSLDKLIEEFRLILIESDVAYPVADRICQTLREKLQQVTVKRFGDARAPAREILQQTLIDILKSTATEDFFQTIEKKRALNEPAVIVFIGINGTGKTTTIAKMAKTLMSKGYSVVLACSDTYRTGSIEQLVEHARRVGARTIKHKYGADAAAVAFDTINHARAQGINIVLIDTAGRMQTDKNLLDEMRKITRVSKPDLTVLVVDALTGNDAVEQGKTFSDAVKIDGIILTKLDADARGGAAISISNVINKPIYFLGTGQSYADLTPFSAEKLVQTIVP